MVEASELLEAFKKENLDCYRLHTALVDQLLPFLADTFELGINPNLLPDRAENETIEQERLRCFVLERLLDELARDIDEDVYEADIISAVDYPFVIRIFYWYLNKIPRSLSYHDKLSSATSRVQASVKRRHQYDEYLKTLLGSQREVIQRRISHGNQKKATNQQTSTVFERELSMPDTLRGTSRSHHPGKTRQVKQSDFKQLIETPLVLEDRGPIDSTYLLRHLVQVVGEKFGDRYEILQTCDWVNLKKMLESGLNDHVKRIGESGRFDVDSLRSIGGMPENSDNPGVYLNILWSASNHQRMWLYVGQSSKLSERIANHNDPWYRRTHASLHYHVWDSVKDIESTFVTLVELKSSTTNADACLLNIQEMWMACIFQTLTAKHLDEYLPLGVCRMWSTRHLNVVPPIWQGFTGNDSAPAEACGGREAFQNLLLSPDPEIRRWAKAVRDSFNDLRNSPDPILRYYYSDIMARNRKLAEKAVEMRKMKELQNVLTNGSQKTVSGYDDDRSAQTLVCSDFCFIISRSLKLGLRVGDQVQLRFHLTEAPTQFAYANKALPTDPASRLVVSIEGIGKNGSFHVCLSSRGERIVRKMNSLMDALEGYTLEESKSFSRRWYVQRRTGTSVRDIIYT